MTTWAHIFAPTSTEQRAWGLESTARVWYVILKPDIGGTLPPPPSPFMNTEGGELRGNHITSGDDEIGQTDRERIRVL